MQPNQRPDLALVPLQRTYEIGCARLPKMNQLVVSACGQQRAIRRESQPIDEPGVRSKLDHPLSGRQVPEADFTLAASGGQPTSIGGEREGNNIAIALDRLVGFA